LVLINLSVVVHHQSRHSYLVLPSNVISHHFTSCMPRFYTRFGTAANTQDQAGACCCLYQSEH
jgi:hypothetical protein